MTRHRKVDVVTVGAGWTAGILAQQWTQAGLDVVSLEQGPARWTYPDFQHNHDHLRYTVRRELLVNLSRQTWTWRPNPMAPSLPMRRYGSFHPGSGVGGAGVHWSAMVWRFLPVDFRYRSHHIERYGIEKLPEGKRIQDWPVTYEELEPYYDRWEYDTGVSGQAGNLNGTLLAGGNIFEGPRRRPFPLPPLETTIPAHMFADASRELGYHPFPQPSSILSQRYQDLSGRTRSGCIYCGFCTRFGCEVDAKSSALTAHIPLALNTGRYEIRTLCHVLRVETGADGLATGVTYVDQHGQEHFQPADIVVLSAFTLENVRLLLMSRSAAHPNGIGNDRNMVGKNYTYQIWRAPATGIFTGRRFNMFMGNTSTVQVLYEYNGDNFDHSELDFIGGSSIFCGAGERDPLVNVADVPRRSGSNGDNGNGDGPPEWGAAWKENLQQNFDAFVPINIQGESLPYEDQFLDLDPNYRDAWGQPLLRLTFDWHQNDYNLYRFVAQRVYEIMERMNPDDVIHELELTPYNIHEYQTTHPTGGAIMGSSPGDSVTNKYGQVWDTPNVFVTGAALYPQNPGSNPTETLCALAYYTAEGVVHRYLNDTNRIMV
jgi:gluconate 2-dehydrogenase alpha chain